MLCLLLVNIFINLQYFRTWAQIKNWYLNKKCESSAIYEDAGR